MYIGEAIVVVMASLYDEVNLRNSVLVFLEAKRAHYQSVDPQGSRNKEGEE